MADRRRRPPGRRVSVPEYRELALRTVSEAQWQAQVIERLQWAGFPRALIYHTRDSRGSQPGFLDLFAVRLRGHVWTVLFVELKREGEELEPAQRIWYDAWCELAEIVNRATPFVRIIVDVWRPGDADAIDGILK